MTWQPQRHEAAHRGYRVDRGRRFIYLLVMLLALAACTTKSAEPRATSSPVPTPTAPAGTPPPSDFRAGDWPLFGFDPARSGVNPRETVLSPTTVEGLQRLWQVTLPGVADSSPALLSSLALPDGTTRDVLFVTTRDGRLLALDARTGVQIWSRQPSGPRITHSSPALDPSRQYVYAYGLDSFVHKYHTTTGDEVQGGGWPVRITRMRETEKESSALNLANGYLYVTTSGFFGDAPPYQGHVVAIRLSDAATHIFNSLCSDIPHLLTTADCSANESGIWARGGAIVDPVTGNIFVVTGNGSFDANQGGHNWGDSVLELSADASRILDSYTPRTYAELEATDADLGSTAPALLPRRLGSKTPYLLVQGGKDGILRLLNRQNLSGAGRLGAIGGEVQALDPLGCGIFTQPVVWLDLQDGNVWVYVASTCGSHAYQARTDAVGATRLVEQWQASVITTTPTIAGGVLFAATSGTILALDPRTGKRLWSSNQGSAGGSIGGIHWESPIIAGGRLYCADEDGHLTAYGL